MATTNQAYSRGRNRLLWAAQGLLALMFLFAGGFKLIVPAATLAKASPLPVPFLRFVAVCEILGAIGLILPGLLHVRESLTPLAAAGLAIVMIGAVTVTIATMGVAPAIMPFVVGCLAVFVAYDRWKVAPLGHQEPAPCTG